MIQPNLGPDEAGVALGGMSNVFITKLKPDGSGLVYSTFLGGKESDNPGGYGDAGLGIVVDIKRNAYVVGTTEDLDFPVTPGALQPQNITQLASGGLASFVSKIDPSAFRLLYSTYLTGSGNQTGETSDPNCDCASAVTLDISDNVYVAGRTASADFPTTPGAFQTQSGFGVADDMAAYVTKFDNAELQSLPLTTTTLTASPNPQTIGEPVTFTASVQSSLGRVPTGTVGFSYQSVLPHSPFYAFGSWNKVLLDGTGNAQFTTTPFSSGAIAVVANYLGDANNTPSIGKMMETIEQIPTTTTITASASSARYATPITFTATVVETASGKAAQGTVSFLLGSTSFETVALNSAGQATWVSGTGGRLCQAVPTRSQHPS